MKVILLEDDQAYLHLMTDIRKLVKDTIKEIKEQDKSEKEKKDEDDDWVSEGIAKQILGIKGRSKMQALRDQRDVEFSQFGRTIRYFKPSLYEFLERNVVKKRNIHETRRKSQPNMV